MYFPGSAERHRLFSRLRRELLSPDASVGKVTLVAMLVVAFVTTTTLVSYFYVFIPLANAANVQTTLTVLNTPPNWTVDAQESVESSTSTPTNAGAVLSFVATATDSSSDPYFLLVCSASSTPTANNNAPPTCGSGIMWARSATTTSGSQATASTSTIETAPFNNESNLWYAYICDANSTGAQCNAAMKNGSSNTISPFVINHPPVFSAISNDSPENPGGTVTWTATASDADTIRGGDTVRLVVCKANDFNSTTGYCGAGGTWATSTLAASNPATTTQLATVLQDKTYEARVFVYDQNLSMATSTNQGFNSSFVVNNVAPSVSSSTMALTNNNGSTPLTLTVPSATSGPYKVTFYVTDNNSCQNASSGNEITLATTSIYRSGVTQNSCQLSSQYDTNSCYPSASSQTLMTCTQDTSGSLGTGDSCSGPNDATVGWVCTFPLWYNADPTDAGSFYEAQGWHASVQAQDDNSLVSPITQTSTTTELASFMAFAVTQTGIAYGGLQPGQNSGTLSTSTDLIAQGNVGLDEDLYGDTMCINWTGFDTCDAGGIDNTQEIAIANQKAGTSSVSYASSFAYAMTASTSPLNVDIRVPKTVATSTQQTRNTWWGIAVPASITVAGGYLGRNVITGKRSNAAYWY